MSLYEIGKEIESLKNRLSEVEQKIETSSNESNSVEEIVDSFQIELIPDEIYQIIDGKITKDFDKSSAPKIFLTGSLGHRRTGFPDNRRYDIYSGDAWLQNNVGDKLKWYFIETGSDRGTRNLEYPNYASGRTAYREARNTHICSFGWRARWYGGHSSAASWGRFVQQNGSGWIYKWSAG